MKGALAWISGFAAMACAVMVVPPDNSPDVAVAVICGLLSIAAALASKSSDK
jgi:hypothetical protein